jgi:hypothetical protein
MSFSAFFLVGNFSTLLARLYGVKREEASCKTNWKRFGNKVAVAYSTEEGVRKQPFSVYK